MLTFKICTSVREYVSQICICHPGGWTGVEQDQSEGYSSSVDKCRGTQIRQGIGSRGGANVNVIMEVSPSGLTGWNGSEENKT